MTISKGTLGTILRNEKYTGTYVFNLTDGKDVEGKRNGNRKKAYEDVIRVEGGMPTLISKEVFQQAQEKMDRNKRQPGVYKAKEIYLLSGLIVCWVASGTSNATLLGKLDELEGQKLQLDQKLLEASEITEKAAITEESLRQLLSQFEDHVAKQEIPEIKKFIASYVEKVIVYEKHVEVIFKVPVVDLLYGGEPWLGKSTIRRRVMLRIFGEAT